MTFIQLYLNNPLVILVFINLLLAPFISIMALHKKTFYGSLLYYLLFTCAIGYFQITESIPNYFIILTIFFIISHCMFGSTRLQVPMFLRTLILFVMSCLLFLQNIHVFSHNDALFFITIFLYSFIGFYVLLFKKYLVLLSFFIMDLALILFNLESTFYIPYLLAIFLILFFMVFLFAIKKTNKTNKFLIIFLSFIFIKILILVPYIYFFYNL